MVTRKQGEYYTSKSCLVPHLLQGYSPSDYPLLLQDLTSISFHFLFSPFFLLETGFLCIIAILVLELVEQANLKLTEICLFLPPESLD